MQAGRLEGIKRAYTTVGNDGVTEYFIYIILFFTEYYIFIILFFTEYLIYIF